MSGGESTVILTIIGVGVAIAGLNLASFRSLRSEMAKQRDGMAELTREIRSLAERVAKLEGLLEGLRESFGLATSTGRAERR